MISGHSISTGFRRLTGCQRDPWDRCLIAKVQNHSHLFYTTSGVEIPGTSYKLANLLDLNPPVRRVMLYDQGCHVGGNVLRTAKDLAENNAGAQVLVVCSKITVITFCGTSEDSLDSL